jgi:hypothetical protein
LLGNPLASEVLASRKDDEGSAYCDDWPRNRGVREQALEKHPDSGPDHTYDNQAQQKLTE